MLQGYKPKKILHIFALFNAAEFFDGQFRFLAQTGGYDLHLAATPNERIDSFCKRNKTTFHPIHIPRILKPWKDIKALRALIKLIRRERFDTIVGHTPKGALLGMVAAWLMGVPKRIYYRHGLIYTTSRGLKRFILKKEEQFVSLLATKIVNVSPSLANLSVKEGLNSPQKQLLIGAGTCGGIDAINTFNPAKIDAQKLSNLKQHLNLHKADVVIGFCGRLCNDKGINELIEGFKLFRKENPAIQSRLLLVGNYDTRDQLSEKTKLEIEKDSDIILTGYINHDIQYYYATMDLFVFPSYREGFGMSVLEASAMQIPVLVSRSHGCVDSIQENETGYYVEISPRSISEGINQLLSEPAIRDKFSINGRNFVLKHYEHRIMWPQVLDLYQKF